MKILVINAGSSSLKYQLINIETEEVLAKGNVERIGIKGGCLTHKALGKTFVIEKEIADHTEAIQLVLNELIDGEAGVIKSMDEIDAVGHRVVASGEAFKKTTLVTDEVMKTMDEIAELAPLHNPAAIKGVNACRAVMPDKKMALVFDTSFHATMPDYAYLYAIDYDDYKTYQVRRYGAHGTSHKFVSQAAAEYLDKNPKSSRSSPAIWATVPPSPRSTAESASIRRWALRRSRAFPWGRAAAISTRRRWSSCARRRAWIFTKGSPTSTKSAACSAFRAFRPTTAT